MVRLLFFSFLLIIFGCLLFKFLPNFQQSGTPSGQINTWTLILGGDVMLGRSVTITALDQKHDPIYPFHSIASVLQSADISLVNLESPIVEKCPRRSDGMVFCAPSQMLAGLVSSGVDIVNLSNNHTQNYGEAGFTETKYHLRQSNIDFTDNTTLVVKTVKDTTVGFIGFDKSQQSNPVLTKEEEDFVRNSNHKCDVLVVSMHWGVEYNAHPTSGQRKLAARLVDLGADVIVGHHPHWVQDTERMESVPVYYSLGNLIFDQPWSEPTKKGLVVRLTFSGNKILKEDQLSTYMKNFTQPTFVEVN